MTDQRSTPIPFLIDLKQTSFASTLDGLSSRAENEDEEGFIMVGPGIQKRKKRRKKKRHKPHNAHEEQAVAPLRSSFDWGSQDMVDNDDGDDDGKDSDDGRSGVAMARDKDASKSCTGECLRAMGADAAVNLGYMKDSLLTKAGWLLTLKRTKADWRAAVTVGLVNLPLSISLAVASGCGPVPGVTTAFWASLITAAFGGCVYNVVGPTGALSGILARNVSLYGVDSLPYLAILTGIVCLIVFLLKWERYVLLVPSSVMEGFTVGVAVIIALNQINFALGLGEIPHHEEFIYNVVESFRHITETDRWSLGLFILSVTSLYILLMSYQKVPWVIILCTLGIILGYLCSNNYIPFQLQTLQTRYGELEFVLVAWPEFKMSYVTIDFFSSSMSIAFVALLETLISAKIADAMTKTTFNQRKEVFGLGLANIITGAVGGIPATAALARTALNINTGATSRMAGILQSIFVLLLSYFLLGYFNYLPLPIVAAVIVVVAIKMVDYHHIVRFWKLDKTVFCLTFFVAAICVLVEPTSGIVVGMVLAMLMFSDMTSRIHSELVMTDHEGGKKFVSDKHIRVGEIDQSKRERKKQHLQELKSAAASHHDENQEARPRSELNRRKHAIYRISGQLTYINSFAHKRRLLMFRSCDCIIISLRYLYYIDIDGLDALQEVIEQLEQENKLVLLSGVNLSVSALILKADWFLRLVAQGKVFATYMDALDSIEGGDGEHGVEQRKLVNIQNF